MGHAMSFDPDYGVYTGQSADPRTPECYEAEGLQSGIEEALDCLRRADPYSDLEAARAYAADAASYLMTASDVPALLRACGVQVSREDMAAICSCISSMLGECMTFAERCDDPIITALDSAAMALMDGGRQ